MSPLWSRLTVRSLSVALLLTALAGGVYAGTDDEPSSDAAAPALVPEQVAAQQALDERARLTLAASRQRAAQEQVARNAFSTARAAAAKAKRVDEAKKKARKKAQATAGGTVPYDGPIPKSCDEYSGNRAIGCAELLKAGFDLDQMPCLDKLFKKESGWNHHAENRGSGAYGIPQALPGSKMASAGSDWRNNPATQIRWGLGYIKGRYQNPCGAWSHSLRTGWY